MISSRRTIPPEEVASHYDELDHFYRDLCGDHVHHGLWLGGDETPEEAVLQLVDLVARAAGVFERPVSADPTLGDPREAVQGTSGAYQRIAPNICDIGCGYGATARFFAARGAKVSAITISPAQFAVARERQGESMNPFFILGDWLTNELPSASFDAAVAIESSEHMPDKSRFFQQAHRILLPGGRLVICAWLAAEKASDFAESWLLEPICREGRMPHLGSATEYNALAQNAGFRLAKFKDITQQVEPTWPSILRRLLGKCATEPRYLKFLFSRHAKNRVFAITIPRIWIAYRLGAMRYGTFTFVKSAE